LAETLTVLAFLGKMLIARFEPEFTPRDEAEAVTFVRS
jgi:hypothetical protein